MIFSKGSFSCYVQFVQFENLSVQLYFLMYAEEKNLPKKKKALKKLRNL